MEFFNFIVDAITVDTYICLWEWVG